MNSGAGLSGVRLGFRIWVPKIPAPLGCQRYKIWLTIDAVIQSILSLGYEYMSEALMKCAEAFLEPVSSAAAKCRC